MQPLNEFISEQIECLEEEIEEASSAMKNVSYALTKTERSYLWSYFAKWKELRYRSLLQEILIRAGNLADDGDEEPF